MINSQEKLDAWLARFLPVEKAIIAEHERRCKALDKPDKPSRRELKARQFGDLCEATEGLAAGKSIREIHELFSDDALAMECLRRYVGTAQWRKLEALRRHIRRPMYYEEENERRRRLRAERRKVTKRQTVNACPTREEILDAWLKVRDSHDDMLRFGSLIMDLECYLDNSLVFGENGRIVRRRGGVKRWLREFLPALYVRYTTVMRYKAAAKKVRQLTDLADPVPAAAVIIEKKSGGEKGVISAAQVADKKSTKNNTGDSGAKGAEKNVDDSDEMMANEERVE